MMKNKTTIIVFGIGLAMVCYGQTPAIPKVSRLVAKSAVSQKAKQDNREATPPTSGATIVKVEPRPSQLMKALDVNKDGKLSIKEIKNAVNIFSTLDQNKDGELTLNEFGPTPESVKRIRDERQSPSRLGVRSGAKPSGQLVRRPTAKQGGSRALAGRKPASSKRPSGKPTRPSRLSEGKKPPTRLSGRPVTKAKDTSASSQPGRKSVARRTSKQNRVAKGGQSSKVAKALTAKKDTEVEALIAETREVTKEIKDKMGRIKDLKQKQAALKWVRTGSRSLLRSLNEGQKATARQKLDEARKLIPKSGG